MITILISIGVALLSAGVRYMIARRKMEKADADARDTVFDQSSLPRTDDLSIIPVVFGTVIITGANVNWYDYIGHTREFDSADGSGRQRFHLLGLHLVFCQGPIDQLHEIRWEHGAFLGTDIGYVDAVETVGPAYWDTKNNNNAAYSPMRIYQDGMISPDPLLFQEVGDESLYKGVFSVVFGETLPTKTPPYSLNLQGPPYAMQWLKTYRTTLPPIQATVARLPGGIVMGNGGANPAYIIREVLTDTKWGMGLTSGDIDDASFEYAAQILTSEGFGLCFIVTSQTTYESFLDEIKRHIDAYIDVDRGTGKVRLTLIRGEESHPAGWPLPPSPIELGPSEIKAIDTYMRPASTEMPTVQVITYDRLYQDDGVWKKKDELSSAIAHDTAGALSRGVITAQPQDYPGIPNPELAARVAQRDLRVASTPTASIEFTVNPGVASGLYAGRVVSITWPKYGLLSAKFRVSEVDFGTLINGEIRVTAAEDVFSFDPASIVPPAVPADQLDIAKPVDHFIFEAPYRLEPDNSVYIFAGVAYKGYKKNTSYTVDNIYSSYGDSPKHFVPQYHVEDSKPFGVDMVATTVHTVEPPGAEMVGRFAYWGEHEIVFVSGRNAASGTVTLSRGMLDTVPHAHEAGERLWIFSGTSGSAMSGLVPLTETYHDGDDVRVLPVGQDGDLMSYAVADPNPVLSASRWYRPYPPRDVSFVSRDDKYGGFQIRFRANSRENALIFLAQDSSNPTLVDDVFYEAHLWGDVGHGVEGYFGLLQGGINCTVSLPSSGGGYSTITVTQAQESTLTGFSEPKGTGFLRAEVYARRAAGPLPIGMESYQSFPASWP